MTTARGRSRDGRVIVARLSRMGPDEAAFDREFWRSVPGEEKVAALWDMVLDAIALQGGEPGDQPRLQRTVCLLQRP